MKHARVACPLPALLREDSRGCACPCLTCSARTGLMAAVLEGCTSGATMMQRASHTTLLTCKQDAWEGGGEPQVHCIAAGPGPLPADRQPSQPPCFHMAATNPARLRPTNPAHLLEGAEEALGVAARGAGAVDALQQWEIVEQGCWLHCSLLPRAAACPSREEIKYVGTCGASWTVPAASQAEAASRTPKQRRQPVLRGSGAQKQTPQAVPRPELACSILTVHSTFWAAAFSS